MLSIGAAGLFWVSSEFAGSMVMAALLTLLRSPPTGALQLSKDRSVRLGAGMIPLSGPTTARVIARRERRIAALPDTTSGTGIAAAVLLLWSIAQSPHRQLLILSATCAAMLLPGVLFAQMDGGFITYLRQCLETSRQEASRTARPGAHFVIDWSQPLIVRGDPPPQPSARVAIRWTPTLTPEMRQRAEAELQLLEPIRRQDDWN
jgi:hypothetical protein